MNDQAKALHIPSLDGIRAIAVSIVFVSHAGLGDLVPGGFGVTIFFFLSGYLITTLLRLEFEATRDISIRHFYLRRVYRILPPMYITLFAVLAFELLRGAAIDWPSVLAQMAHLTNYWSIFHGDDGLLPYTGIMWSLAVEEHFYLLYPLLLGLALKRYDYRRIAQALGVFCAAILLWRCYLVFGVGVDHEYTYKATDTRIDSIAYGCIMALVTNPALDYRGGRQPSKNWLFAFVVGFGAFAFTFVYRNEAFRETIRYSLHGLALWPVFFCAVQFPKWPIFAWLETSAVRWMGTISYTFYLVHLLVLASMGTIIGNPWLVAVAGFVVTVLISLAMYFLVERRMGRLRRRLHS